KFQTVCEKALVKIMDGQGRKVEGGSKNPKGPLGTCFQKFKKPKGPPLAQFSICSRGSKKNQGSPLGSFFYQLKGVSQKIDFFPKIFGSGGVKTPPVPMHALFYFLGIGQHSRSPGGGSLESSDCVFLC